MDLAGATGHIWQTWEEVREADTDTRGPTVREHTARIYDPSTVSAHMEHGLLGSIRAATARSLGAPAPLHGCLVWRDTPARSAPRKSRGRYADRCVSDGR